MIDGKTEITFPATEVEHVQLARGGQIFINFRDVLGEAVDLAEFRLFFVVDAPVFVGDAEFKEKRLAAVEQIRLGAIVRTDFDFLP